MATRYPAHPILALLLTVVLVTLAGACAHGPVIDTGSKPVGVGGTISGIVRSGPAAPLIGRKVTATDVATGTRFEATTATNGGYTMKVPVGKYRIEVELRAGENVANGPSEVEIRTSDLDAGRDFVINVR